MNTIDSSNILSQMRELSAQAQGVENKVDGAEKDGFSKMFNDAINTVNETQQEAGKLKTAFELGDPTVDLTQVMVASQKASISFQAMIQVRNKMVSAYQDVIRMQI